MENKTAKSWDTKGVTAAFLAIPGYFIAAVAFVLYMIKLNAFNSVTVLQLVLFVLAMDIIPIIQIVLASISLKQNPKAHKWSAILAIVLASCGIVLWTIIMVGAYL